MTVKIIEKFEIWPIERLVPYDNNPRVHPESQIDTLIGHFKTYGFIIPILVDGKNGIIAGHGRLTAAKKMGLEKVPVCIADHLDEATKQAFIIADNESHDKSYFDEGLLKINLSELSRLNFDLPKIGLSKSKLDSMLKEAEEILNRPKKQKEPKETKEPSTQNEVEKKVQSEPAEVSPSPEPTLGKSVKCPSCGSEFVCPK